MIYKKKETARNDFFLRTRIAQEFQDVVMVARVVYNIDDRIKMQLAMVYTLIEKGKYARPKVYQIEEII